MILYYVECTSYEFGNYVKIFRNKKEADKFVKDLDKDVEAGSYDTLVSVPTKIDIPANKDSAVIVLNNLFGIIHGN